MGENRVIVWRKKAMNFMCVCEERIEIWVTGQEAFFDCDCGKGWHLLNSVLSWV